MIQRINNFDLIRLTAALQVVVWHSIEHLSISGVKGIHYFLGFFPGVPIFFTISGFLVYASYENNADNPIRYFVNRGLRIFPALWGCFLVTVVLLLSFGVLHLNDFYQPPMIAWVVSQLTIGQFYTPDLLRAWGVGTPNGSLWTIPVEVQFYLLVPIVFWVLKKSKNYWVIVLLILMCASYSTNVYIYSFDQESMLRKLGSVFAFPYLYQFLLGILVYKSWNSVGKFIEGKAPLWLFIYGLYSLVFSNVMDFYYPSYWPNFPGLLANLLLGTLTLALAFSKRNLSENILKGNDISYGVYIYHMLVINTFLSLGLLGSVNILFYCILGTCLMAFLSWQLIEKPALSMKKTIMKFATK